MNDTAFQSLIADTPQRLLRTDIASNTADPKLPDTPAVIYAIPADKTQAERSCAGRAVVKTFDNPAAFLHADAQHGLLYLPYPYLVPGGRFNEMYGWDTAFPVFAWVDTHPKMMREQVDNQLYQIRAYGKVLNANRTYYLSRSQPPLIAAMVLHVWQAAQKRDWRDFDPDGVYTDARAWLAAAYNALQTYYAYWTTDDRLANGGPLSRYWDEGDVPAIEVLMSEPGHFEHARKHFLKEPDPRFYDATAGELTSLYYRADRAMRASGLDPTSHWSYGGLKCIFHAPLCLNALLYRMEGDMAEIAHILSLSGDWEKKQAARLAAMRALMLDPETGLFHDYDFDAGRRNTDPFATFFHALWAGLYDGDETGAKLAATLCLIKLETPHGLCTSTRNSGSQWDRPNGWPPLHYFAFAGLGRCGLQTEARRIAQKYVTLAARVYTECSSLFEKYNVEKGNADVRVVHGYDINVSEQGTFLWTAAVLKLAQDFLELKP